MADGAGLPPAASSVPSRAQRGGRARVCGAVWVLLSGDGRRGNGRGRQRRAPAGSVGLGRGFQSHVSASGDSCGGGRVLVIGGTGMKITSVLPAGGNG